MQAKGLPAKVFSHRRHPQVFHSNPIQSIAWVAMLSQPYIPLFNRLNARVSSRLNALPLSFLLYNRARTSTGG